jgi:drug/metabolite transporter, DME family
LDIRSSELEEKFETMKLRVIPKSPRWGYAYVMVAALLWAVSGSSSKFLFHQGISPFQLVQLRITLATVCLFIWLFLKNKSLLRVEKGDVVYFVILGIFGMAAVQFTYLFAISKINVAAAILLQYMAPIFIALFSVIFAGEKLKKSTVAAIIIATFGCWLVVGAYNLNVLSMNSVGIFSGIASAIAFAWYSVHGEYGMRKYHPWTVLFYAILFAALVWNVLHPPLEAFFHKYSLLEWWWIFYIAIFGTVLPFGLYLEGINLIRATRSSITGMLEPITAGALSYIFLNEVMEPLQLTGGVMVIFAIILLQLRQDFDDKAPALIRAGKKSNWTG